MNHKVAMLVALLAVCILFGVDMTDSSAASPTHLGGFAQGDGMSVSYNSEATPEATLTFEQRPPATTISLTVLSLESSQTVPVLPAQKEVYVGLDALELGQHIFIVTDASHKKIAECTLTVQYCFEVELKPNGGTGTAYKDAVLPSSTTYTIPECVFEAPKGKEFSAWSDGIVQYNPGDKITVSDDVTLNALWKDSGDEPSGSGSNDVLLYVGIAAVMIIIAIAVVMLLRRDVKI